MKPYRSSRLGQQNTPTASLQRGKTPPMSDLDMTSNNLMVRFHTCLSFGKYRLLLYCHLQHHNDTIIKTQEDFFRKIFVPLTLFVRFRKGCVGFYCERELETEQKLQYFDPHSYGRQCCVFLVLQGCSTGGPEAQRPTLLGDLLHLSSNFSAPQLNRGPRAPSAWCGFPYHISSITSSDLQLQLS